MRGKGDEGKRGEGGGRKVFGPWSLVFRSGEEEEGEEKWLMVNWEWIMRRMRMRMRMRRRVRKIGGRSLVGEESG